MKTLLLLRHAKSRWDEPVDDHDRGLNARGRQAAARMGHELRRLEPGPDLVLASSARRVVETLSEMGPCAALAPRFDRRLYEATAEQLLDIVRSADKRVARLLLVGHNPGLAQLAGMLIGDGDPGLRTQLLAKFPTAALAQIALPIDDWRDAEPDIGVLTSFVRPRDLDGTSDATARAERD